MKVKNSKKKVTFNYILSFECGNMYNIMKLNRDFMNLNGPCYSIEWLILKFFNSNK